MNETAQKLIKAEIERCDAALIEQETWLYEERNRIKGLEDKLANLQEYRNALAQAVECHA